MLFSLEARRLGLELPRKTVHRHKVMRSRELEMASHRVFSHQDTDKCNMYSMDIDHSENRYLLSSGNRGHIEIHDLAIDEINVPGTYKCIAKLPSINTLGVLTVHWYSVDNGLFFSSGTDGILRIWDSNTLDVIRQVTLYETIQDHSMSTIAKKHQLIALAFNGKRREIALFDLHSGNMIHKLRGHQSSPTLVKWSPSNSYHLASAGLDSKCLLWDIRNASGPLHTFCQSTNDAMPDTVYTAHNGPIKSIEFSSNGNQLISHGKDSKLHVWNVRIGEYIKVNFGKIKASRPNSVSTKMSVSKDTNVLAVPSQKNIEIVDFTTGERIKTLTGHLDQVTACMFDKTNQDLYSTGQDGQIIAWSHDRIRHELTNHIQADTWSDSD